MLQICTLARIPQNKETSKTKKESIQPQGNTMANMKTMKKRVSFDLIVHQMKVEEEEEGITDTSTTSDTALSTSTTLPPSAIAAAADDDGEDSCASSKLFFWYTREDMQKTYTREKLLMELYARHKTKPSSCNVLKAYSTHGLLTIPEYRAKKVHKMHVANRIFEEQEYQLQNDIHDVESLSNVYIELTKESVVTAHEIALQLQQWLFNDNYDDDDASSEVGTDSSSNNNNNSNKVNININLSQLLRMKRRRKRQSGRNNNSNSKCTTPNQKAVEVEEKTNTTTTVTTMMTPAGRSSRNTNGNSNNSMMSTLRRQQLRFLFRR